MMRPRLVSLLFATFLFVSACGEKPRATGLVVADAGPPQTTSAADAGPVDITQCASCQLAPQQDWTFQGVYRDNACTDPLVQMAPPACGTVPALGSASVTYAFEVGGRKAGQAATITLTEQIAPEATRYEKVGTKCVPANEAAVHVTPAGCAGARVCRDDKGALACTGCRTLANGCPDFEETRLYAAVDDPVAKGKPGGGGGGGGNVERLRQCCAALSAQARALGSSPEAGIINSVAAQCAALAAQVGPNGNAPELGVLRSALAGRTIPAICAGF
jgi:hypothetical protein